MSVLRTAPSQADLVESARNHIGGMFRAESGWQRGFDGDEAAVSARIAQAWEKANQALSSGAPIDGVAVSRWQSNTFVTVEMGQNVGNVIRPNETASQSVTGVAFMINRGRVLATYPSEFRAQQPRAELLPGFSYVGASQLNALAANYTGGDARLGQNGVRRHFTAPAAQLERALVRGWMQVRTGAVVDRRPGANGRTHYTVNVATPRNQTAIGTVQHGDGPVTPVTHVTYTVRDSDGVAVAVRPSNPPTAAATTSPAAAE